ncbi:hypothetical protein [Maridesulfovibrio bastinii]|uniref:hypothetical protein n=1 Tax=Maridesulfovibrio bastinii TaxID=47157 RepID=UPI0004155521|nr:hypothetical protein [Maridesulfovibrio bastinii]
MSIFKFLEWNGKAYIYDNNQERLFEMGCEASLDVPDDIVELVLNEGTEVDKDKAWQISGLDKFDPS